MNEKSFTSVNTGLNYPRNIKRLLRRRRKKKFANKIPKKIRHYIISNPMKDPPELRGLVKPNTPWIPVFEYPI